MGGEVVMLNPMRYARRGIYCCVDVERSFEALPRASVALKFIVGFATVDEGVLRPFVASLCPAVV